jgi:hypothetical protein
MDWTQSPKTKESPDQKIKRLERELEHLRNLLFNEVVNILCVAWDKPSKIIYSQEARSFLNPNS